MCVLQLLQVCVNLVDVNTRRLVHALIVCTDAALPPLHRQLEVRALGDVRQSCQPSMPTHVEAV